MDVQRRLGRAATLAAATGKVGLFAASIKASLGDPFAGVLLFQMVDGNPRLVDSLGEPTMAAPASAQVQDVVQRAASKGSLALTRLATDTDQRLGYAMAATALGHTYVAYAEQGLPGNRRAEIPTGSPLAIMTFAIYYGRDETSSSLVETNTDDLPISSATMASATIPFGDQVLTAVVTPRSPLLGRFAAWLAWLIAGAGLLLTAVMVLLTERLQRRRAVAEQLAAVTGELYRTQRGVAETLQTALLPKHLPRTRQLTVATRYLAGTEGIDVGGDWYDVVSLPGDRLFFTIGDVSGRGLSAATMMSRLRHSMTAYAVEGNDPGRILAKVSDLVDIVRDEHFATALCGILELETGTVTIANAGHPPLVQVSDGVATPVVAPLGPPLGVGGGYETARLALTPGAVLLAYTDGLVERRDEPIDAGIAHLCQVAQPAGDLEALLDTLLAALSQQGASQDDAAILGLQWNP